MSCFQLYLPSCGRQDTAAIRAKGVPEVFFDRSVVPPARFPIHTRFGNLAGTQIP